jgi:hypothetical protein
MAMEPTPHPDMGLDALFDVVVQPVRKLSDQRKRIDGAIGRALGPLASRLRGREEVRAFGGARETVLRAAKSDAGMVVVEGVNLAGVSARRDADALVSRLLRIQAGSGEQRTAFVIGYLASPGGLNGETHMRAWMVKQIGPDVYDLNLERVRFQTTTKTLLEQSGGTLPMF